MGNHHKEGISGPHFMGEGTIKIPVNNRAKEKNPGLLDDKVHSLSSRLGSLWGAEMTPKSQ